MLHSMEIEYVIHLPSFKFIYCLLGFTLLIKVSADIQTFNLFGTSGEGYYLEVYIGTPPQIFNVLIDTGSSNLAIASYPHPNVDSYFIETNSSTFSSQNIHVSLSYTQGNWSGHIGNDVIFFPSLNAPIVQCDFSLITSSYNFFMNNSNWQGILGLAYQRISKPDNMAPWLNSVHYLQKCNNIAFSLELCGHEGDKKTHYGHFILYDCNEDSPPLYTSPIIREWFYEIVLFGIRVGGTLLDVHCRYLNTDKTILDSGTTNIRLPRKIHSYTVNILKGLSAHDGYKINESLWNLEETCFDTELKWNIFPNISFLIAHSPKSYFVLELPPMSFIRPIHNKSEGDSGNFCYKLAIEPSDSGSVLGAVVMEGLKVTFNQSNKTIGFMESKCGPSVNLYGPFTSAKDDIKICTHYVERISALKIAGDVVLGSTILAVVIAFGYFASQRLFNKKIFHSRIEENLIS